MATEEEEMALSNITDPVDTDVLCGRGGAALRHPGNQTYRRLVNLNKGLYITCLKTEKLKISRSIVAAIREQKGRFLEKDSKSGTWYDIGDKKAVEKTSQALREGQPKLRQKIVEMGGGAAGTAALMESQYGHPGLGVPEQVGLTNSLDAGHQQHAALQHQHQQQQMSSQELHADLLLQRLSLKSDDSVQQAALQQVQDRLRPSITQHSSVANDLGLAASQLSLMSEFSAFNSSHHAPQQVQQNPMNPGSMMSMDSFRQAIGMQLSGHSTLNQNVSLNAILNQNTSQGILSNTSQGMMMSNMSLGMLSNHQGQQHQRQSQQQPQQQQPQHSSQQDSNPLDGMDRRRVFARMKYNRPPSDIGIQAASDGSLGEGGGFRPAESNMSMLSNNDSKHTPNNMSMGPPGVGAPVVSSNGGSGNPSNNGSMGTAPQMHHKVIVEVGKIVDHSSKRDREKEKDWMGDHMSTGSRFSMMSGLSRISDNSVDQSIFSDLSRKIGNVNTSQRSIAALSDMSALDMEELSIGKVEDLEEHDRLDEGFAV